MALFSRHYVFDGMRNARDLGGYAVPGGVTRFGVFIRSDLPRGVTPADLAKLSALGIRASVDLRDLYELESNPDELREVPGIEYKYLRMLHVRKAASRSRPGERSAFETEFFWGEEYVRMLEDNHAWARDCAEYMASGQGAVLFHCFTGKDRTGILAALLLGTAGVSRDDIAADYAVSQIYLEPVYRWMREYIDDFADAGRSAPFFSTAAENILFLTDHLEREYGGVGAFLRQCGAGEDVLEAIRRRLVKRA